VIISFFSALKKINDEKLFIIFIKDETKTHLNHAKQIRKDVNIKKLAF
jgi:hypothetical protein